MKVSTKKTIASTSGIVIICALTAFVRLWAAPRIGLDLTAQVFAVGTIIMITKTAYFLAVELNEESDIKSPILKIDSPSESNRASADN